jgi:uncharacterized protein DUF6602
MEGMAAEAVERLSTAAAVEHPGETGHARERVIGHFLRRLVPGSFDIGTGFAIDAAGDISEQLDIVIYRRTYHPTFEVGGVQYFPVESIAAVIQNKASVASRAALRSALGNLESVKRLDRTGGGRNYAVVGQGRGSNVDPDDYNFQVWTAILTEASLAPDTLAEEMRLWIQGRPRRLWPNVYVDVRRFASFYEPEDHGATARPATAVTFNLTALRIPDPRIEPPLMDFASLLLDFLRVTELIDYNPLTYLPRSVASTRMFEVPPGTTD